MKILVVRGNPRKNGYTQYITDLVVKGASEAGAEIDDIDLHKKKINECLGCYNCWTVTPGTCIHRDDIPDLLELLLTADILLCSTPLYNYAMSSSMKRFLERTLSLFKQGIIQRPNGLLCNNLRYPDKWRNKKLAFVSAGALKSIENFKGLTTTFKLLANGMNMDYCGGLIRPESYFLQFRLAKPKTVKIIESSFIQSGRELATEGKLSEKIQNQVSTLLSVDTFHFKKYSDIYWEHIASMGAEGANLEEVRYSVTSDVRILMREMARAINPQATATLRAVLQFDFPDINVHYCLKVNKGSCSIEEKECQSFDLRVTVDSITWANVFMREIPVKDALKQKKIHLEGKKILFTRLDRYFPPPAT